MRKVATFLIKEANQILGVKIPVARKRKNMTREWPKADLQGPFLTLKTLKLNGQKVEQALDLSHTRSSAFRWINGSHVNLFAPPKPRHHITRVQLMHFCWMKLECQGFFLENRESKCVGAGVGKDSLAWKIGFATKLNHPNLEKVTVPTNELGKHLEARL